MYNNREYKPTHITTSATNQIFTGRGTFHGVIVNATSGSTFSIYDGILGGTSTTIGVLKASVVEGDYIYDAVIANGLYVIGGTTGDYTVLWVQG